MLLLVALAAANLALALAALARLPGVNGPAEWRWEYVPATADNLTPVTAGRPGSATAGTFSTAAAGRPGSGPGRAPGPADAYAASMSRGLTALALAAAAAIVFASTSRRLARRPAALALAMACGLVFTFALVAASPGGTSRVMAAMASRNGFGYAWDASLAPSTAALLADYPAASADLNQHSLTHPPGPLLLVRAVGIVDRLLPAPTPTLSATPSEASPAADLVSQAESAVAREVERARRHGRPVPQPPPAPRVLVMLAFLLPVLGALAAWPLYRLALTLGQGRHAALLAAALWLLVPARSLFTPSLDQALPLLLVGAAAIGAGAAGAAGGARPASADGASAASTGGGNAWRAAAAGFLLFCACFLSYGSLPLLPLVAACAWAAHDRRQGARSSEPMTDVGSPEAAANVGDAEPVTATRRPLAWPALIRWLAALALGFGVPYLALAVGTGHDPWPAVRVAFEHHHRIAVEPRSYRTWLLWDPYDFALLLSPAILGLAAAATLCRAATGRPAQQALPAGRSLPSIPAPRPAWVWAGLLLVLWLSGGVRGEAGRIWLPWMPFACLFAAEAIHRRRRRVVSAEPPTEGDEGDAGDGGPNRGPDRGWDAAGAAVLATEAALTAALAASMTFIS